MTQTVGEVWPGETAAGAMAEEGKGHREREREGDGDGEVVGRCTFRFVVNG